MLNTKITPITYKKNKKGNDILGILFSLRSIYNIILISSILIGGAILLIISLVYSGINLSNSVVYKQNEVNSVIKEALNNYLNKGITTVNLMDQLLKVYGKNDSYSLYRSSVNTRVNLFTDGKEVEKAMVSHCMGSSVMNSRYYEENGNGVSVNYDPIAKTSSFLSYADKGLFSLLVNDMNNINESLYTVTAPIPTYDITKKDWYYISKNSGKEAWTVYFSGYVNQAMSYSRPIFFANGTMKATLNSCFDYTITRDFLKSFLKSENLDIIITEANGDLISHTIDNVNITNQIWNPAKSRWEGVKINAMNSSDKIKEVYVNYINNKNAIINVEGSQFYAQYPQISNDWMVAILLDKYNTDLPFYSSLIANLFSYVIFFIIAIFFANLLMIIVTKLYFSPVDSRIQNMLYFGDIEKNPIFIPSEFSLIYKNSNKISHLHKELLNWLPYNLTKSLKTEGRLTVKNINVNIISICLTLKNIELYMFLDPEKLLKILNEVFFFKIGDYFETHKDSGLIWDSIDYSNAKIYIVNKINEPETASKNALDFINHMIKIGGEYTLIGCAKGDVLIASFGNKIMTNGPIGNSVYLSQELAFKNSKYNTEILITEDLYDKIPEPMSNNWCLVDYFTLNKTKIPIFSFFKSIKINKMKKVHEYLKNLKNRSEILNLELELLEQQKSFSRLLKKLKDENFYSDVINHEKNKKKN